MPNIVLNYNNVANLNNGNNILVYDFQGGGVQFKNNEIALTSLQMYYSWFNINQLLYNNNTYQYVWIDGTIVNVVIPDGYYSLEEINSYLENVMVTNNHYLIDTTRGDFVYYLQWETNASFYAIQLNSFPVPSSLPVGYALPVGATWSLPLTPTTPQITILPNGFRNIVGFDAGTYPTPTQSTTYGKLSDFTPQIQPISSVQITCSLIANPYSSSSKTIYAFGIPETIFGGQVLITPPEFVFNKIVDGVYNQFVVEIIDQDGLPVLLRDPQMCILLNIRDRGINQ
jgi:hypothetical protein